MEKAIVQNNQEPTLEAWLKPEVKLFQITEETLGGGAAGPDFGSEIS